MEPHREEEQKKPEARVEPKRFRLIELEERIAPKAGGNHSGNGGGCRGGGTAQIPVHPLDRKSVV